MEPYVFVARPFEGHDEFFERVSRVVRDSVKLACEDGKIGPSQELRAHVLGLIARSELLVAEISTRNPNVLYEVGFATGIRKTPLLIAKKGSEIPADIQGLKRIEYAELDENFDASLTAHLKWEIEINSRVGLLRDMLEGPVAQPAFILASPKYPPPGVPSPIQYFDTRTFGDNLGVLGLISSFASMWGPGNGVERLSAQYTHPAIMGEDVNLYLIGSPKANPLTQQALRELHNGPEEWSFGGLGGKPMVGNYTSVLRRKVSDTLVDYHALDPTEDSPPGARTHEGYGLVVRGPHPRFPKHRMLTIMAGGRSVGTGAACLAATHAGLIQKIRDKLPRATELSDKACTFWALVKGSYSDPRRLLEPENVTVTEAGTLPRAL
jgi:hypothetical protein